MFDYELNAEVKRIETLVPKVDGPVTKVCRVTFRRDFDTDIARGVGGEFAVKALEQLDDRAITQVVFPIDAICVKATLRGSAGDVLVIDEVSGIKAIGKAKKLQEDKEPDEPQVELKFQFKFSKEAWAFFGDNACNTISVKLSKRQLSLSLGAATATPEAANADGTKNGEAAKKSKASKKGKATTKSSHGADRAEAAGEIESDPQSASSPEEAERIRAQRLREARQMEDNVWDDEGDKTDASGEPAEDLVN
jgi:hypothetical protein